MSPYLFVVVGLLLLGPAAVSLSAQEPSQVEPRLITSGGGLEQQIGRLKIRASGKTWGNAHRAKAGVERRRLRQTPWFLSFDGRTDVETRSPYDVTHWGGRLGLGWELNPTTDVLATYRLDGYKVYNTSPAVDQTFQRVAGRTQVAAIGAVWRHDSRDDSLAATRGVRFTQTGELAIEAFGGDYDVSRLETDVAYYVTPFRERSVGTWLADVTFVEHAQFGWVENFGDTDEVPFFERYYTGGPKTVRGSRSRWYTPRGSDQEIVGGELQIVNNVEARLPIFPERFDRKLAVAAFFDAGRSYRRWSEIGDFGYGVGGGLRYAVRWGPLAGVARAEYGINLDDEGDNTSSHMHLTFGTPF